MPGRPEDAEGIRHRGSPCGLARVPDRWLCPAGSTVARGRCTAQREAGGRLCSAGARGQHRGALVVACPVGITG